MLLRLKPEQVGGGTWRRKLHAGALVLAVACARDGAPELRAAAASASAQPREPALDLSEDLPWPDEYARDPVWVRASTGDDIDQARLARREGAEALLAALARGGSLGRTALAALPYASDRRGALGALCALLPRAAQTSQGPLIGALYDVVMNAPAAVDVLDPGAEQRCGEVLKEALRRELPDPGDRDRAQVVLARLGSS